MTDYEIARASRIADIAKRAKGYAEAYAPDPDYTRWAIREAGGQFAHVAGCGEIVTIPGLTAEENRQINADADAAWDHIVASTLRARVYELRALAAALADAVVLFDPLATVA